jgi:hypothetical protein
VRKRRRRGPVLGSHAEVAKPKHYSVELPEFIETKCIPACQAHLDPSASPFMPSGKTRRQCGRVVRNHQISGV